ncbi:MAG: TIGR04325 family methyltransferase [Thermosphaera sp.]
MKQFIRKFMPPIVFDILRKFKSSRYGWYGDYQTWEDAKKDSIGYDSDKIIQKVRASLLKVREGKAIYERDSVIFDEIQYSWPLLAGLMYAAAKSGGVLKVCDFGGNLGSTYYQNRKFLARMKEVSWSIVEQRHFVDVGKTDFENDQLKFYYDLQFCVIERNPNVLLLSSVIQYTEKPYEVLNELLKHNFEFIIVDRTPFNTKPRDRLTVQVVPPWIYEASYPCWFLHESKFLQIFKDHNYNLLESFYSLDGVTREYVFKGFIWERIDCSKGI